MSGFESQDKPSQDQLLNCMRCGMCLPSCPTFQLTGRERSSPRGRIALMRAVEEGQLDLESDTFAEEMDFCLGCMACVSACPAGVQYGQLLEASRDQLRRRQARRIPCWKQALERAAFSLFEKPWLLRLFARSLYLYQASGLANLLQHSGALNALPLNLGKLHGLLPTLPSRFSSQTIPAVLEPARGQSPGAAVGLRVGLSVGCVMDVMLAKENEATARVLQRHGCRVATPCGQGCCGALHAHAGHLQGARRLARKMIDTFEPLSEGGELDIIVVNSAGCGNCMKGYGHLLHDDPEYAEKAVRFAGRVKDVHEVLAGLPLQVPSVPLAATVTYHDACHLAHGQGVRSQPRAVCRAAARSYRELPQSDRCCGSAGTYNITHFETSMELLQQKIDEIESTGADLVGVANPGCLLQIQYGLRQRGSPVRAEHPVVLLDEAYRNEDAGS
jgi:glycolate oxidase iron-sulfur subunit